MTLGLPGDNAGPGQMEAIQRPSRSGALGSAVVACCAGQRQSKCDLGNVSVRVAVVVSISVLGLSALSACAPAYYEYGEAERYRERESREYFQEEEQQSRQRARARMRAEARARAKARQERAKETARVKAPEKVDEEAPQQSRVVETAREAREEPVAAAPVKSSPVQQPPQETAQSTAEPAEAAKEKPTSEGDQAAAREAGQKQIEDGYRLLRAGFVKKARERFERAMGANAADASLGQGRTMDPSYLKSIAFPDVVPDAEQARRMYRRSILLGNPEAKGDLDRLEKAMAAAAPEALSPSSPGQGEQPNEAPVRQQ